MAKRKVTTAPEIVQIPITVCLAVIVVAIGVLLHESLVGGKGLVPSDGVYAFLPWSTADGPKPSNLLLADQYLEFVPSRQFFHDQLREGRFPLWNPHVASGVPSLASMQGAALYPINLALSPLSPFVASGLAALAKLIVAGVFTLLFLRRIGLTNGAALVGALTFAFSGFLIVWLGHPHTNAAVFLPAVFYFVEGIVRGAARAAENEGTSRGSLRPWCGLAVTFGFVFLGGHLPTVVHMLLATAAYATFRLFTAGIEHRLRLGLLLAAALIAGVLVAAPQVFPFAEYYQVSSMSQSSERLSRAESHLQPATLLHFVMPYVTGAPTVAFYDLSEALGLGRIANFNERTGYVGLLALFLTLVAFARRRTGFTIFFGGLACVAMAIVYGVPPLPAILSHTPVLQSINHARLLLWVDWSLAVLAAIGADVLIRSQPQARPKVLAVVFTAGVALFGLSIIGLGNNVDRATQSFLLKQVWVLVGGLAVIVLITRRGTHGRWIPAVCVAWTTLDLLWFASGYNPAIEREKYKPATGAIQFLQKDRSQFRILGINTILAPNTSSMYGIDDVRGQDFVTIARYEELITGRAGNFSFYSSAPQLPPDLAMRNVKYILAPQRTPADPPNLELVYDAEVAIYRNRRYLERAIAVFDYRVESNPNVILNAVRAAEFAPDQTVLLEDPPAGLPAESPTASANGPAEVRITKYEPDDVTIEARMPRAGFVLLMDTYFPGWTATVDGQTVPIYRADYTYRAVRVPAGAHTVTFTYRPSSFRWGVGTSLLTMGLLAALWWRGRPRTES